MGMFDTIKCEVTLPINKKIAKNFRDKNWNEVNFQTKDLDCTLSTFIIKKNKTLVNKIVKTEWVEKKKEKGFKGFIEKIRKDKWKFPYQIIEKGTSYKKVKYTGIINFYSIETDINDNEWDLEFNAKFVDGVLTSLKLKSAKIWRTSSEVIQSNNHIRNLLLSHEEQLPNKIRKILHRATLGYWRWFWCKVDNFIRKITNKICNLIRILH